ncbi:MAG: PEP-CTERM sorting domain-containing protein [Chthonomonadaceae bacterium]|nr:PEP-CTERM sorting domain-containing protein [Chthonomonadaceae bacterium]
MTKSLFTAFAILSVASAHAFTVATFADPSTVAESPLFTWDRTNNTLSGVWTASGLTLETPGLTGGGSVSNAHFVMDPVQLTPVINGQYYLMSRGSVRFFTNDINNPFLTITFAGGSFLNPSNAGASSTVGNSVAFAGPNVGAGWSQETFSFSLTNAMTVGNITTFTSSFTSSAVPEPASMVILATGVAALIARRRKA